MEYCPNCRYTFDIVKSSQTSAQKETRITLDKIHDALKKFEANEDMTKYIASFNREDTGKNKKYQKLTDNEKIKFNQIFEQLTSSGAEFKCENCNNIEPITKTVLLHRITMEEENTKMRTIEESEFICQDPILPRTHNYICKNPSCITHVNPDKREAIFFKEKNSFKVNHICSVCFYSW
jgi:hypothetical protein